MRIVVLTEYLSSETAAPYGGVDWRERNLARILGREHDVVVIASNSNGIRHEKFGTYDVLRVGARRDHVQRGDFRRRMSYMSEAWRRTASLRPDVVCGSGFVSWAPAKKAALRLDVPSVAVVHEVWRGNWLRNMGVVSGVAGYLSERRIIKGFDSYVAVSRVTASDLARIGIPAGRIRVITNGVDQDFFDENRPCGSCGVPTLLTVGRLTRYKRVSDLLESSANLLSRGIAHRLTVVGEGPERRRLECMAYDLGIAGTTTFLGRIPNRAEFIELFKSSDVFVLPSVSEGMGMVLAEAMAARLPYVAADIPALRETSFNGKGGYLFRPGDIQDLTELIICAIGKGRTDEGYLLAKTEYDWSRIARVFESHLTEIVSNGG